MYKTIHILTKSLKDTGHEVKGFFSNDQVNIITMVDGEDLSNRIEKEINSFASDGYEVVSIIPIMSSRVEKNSLHFQYTSSVIITLKKN